MSRPPVLDPMAQKVVRTCWQAEDIVFTQAQLADVLGCSRDVIARTVAGLSHTPRAGRTAKKAQGEQE